MRLIKRNDTPLAAGLIASALILFHQPFRFGLDAVREIEGDTIWTCCRRSSS